MDLMSLRSFTQLKIRKSISGEKFTHWFPLWFGESEVFNIETKEWDPEAGDDGEMVVKTRTVDTYERFETHINKTMSFCVNGSSRKPYTPIQAMFFMLKIIGTHIVSLMDEKKHCSIVTIRRLLNFFRILFYFIKTNPEIQDIIETRIEEFVNNAESRHKNICKNLLDY